MRKSKIKTCKYSKCGKSFTPQRSDAETCSSKCRVGAARERKKAKGKPAVKTAITLPKGAGFSLSPLLSGPFSILGPEVTFTEIAQKPTQKAPDPELAPSYLPTPKASQSGCKPPKNGYPVTALERELLTRLERHQFSLAGRL